FTCPNASWSPHCTGQVITTGWPAKSAGCDGFVIENVTHTKTTGNKRALVAPKAFRRRMLSHHFPAPASSDVSAYSLQVFDPRRPPVEAAVASPATARHRQKPLFSSLAMADNNAGGSRPPQGGLLPKEP